MRRDVDLPCLKHFKQYTCLYLSCAGSKCLYRGGNMVQTLIMSIVWKTPNVTHKPHAVKTKIQNKIQTQIQKTPWFEIDTMVNSKWTKRPVDVGTRLKQFSKPLISGFERELSKAALTKIKHLLRKSIDQQKTTQTFRRNYLSPKQTYFSRKRNHLALPVAWIHDVRKESEDIHSWSRLTKFSTSSFRVTNHWLFPSLVFLGGLHDFGSRIWRWHRGDTLKVAPQRGRFKMKRETLRIKIWGLKLA